MSRPNDWIEAVYVAAGYAFLVGLVAGYVVRGVWG